MMEKVILLTASYKGYPLEIVKELMPEGFTLVSMDTTSHRELVEKAEQADYILASGNLKIDGEVLAVAKKLKMVHRLGVGLDSLDISALKDRDIPVYRNEGINAASVAEHALMFILASLRKLTLINNYTKKGVWKKQELGVMTRELSTQTVGLIGMGNIAKRLANLLKPFGCKVVYYDIFRMTKDQENTLFVDYKSLDELFGMTDVISLHCPSTESTNGIIRKENLDKMKDGVIIINTSRGKLINEEDLLMALDSGKVGFAALDVYQEEPLKNLALAGHENVIGTPHIAGNSYDSFRKMMEAALGNISLYDQDRLFEIEESRIRYT